MLSFAVSNVKTAAVINDASIATSSPVGQASVNARGEDCGPRDYRHVCADRYFFPHRGHSSPWNY